MDLGRWKLVINTSTTRHGYGRRMNRPLCPEDSPVAAHVSRARTTVVPTATTRPARAMASRASGGTR